MFVVSHWELFMLAITLCLFYYRQWSRDWWSHKFPGMTARTIRQGRLIKGPSFGLKTVLLWQKTFLLHTFLVLDFFLNSSSTDEIGCSNNFYIPLENSSRVCSTTMTGGLKLSKCMRTWYDKIEEQISREPLSYWRTLKVSTRVSDEMVKWEPMKGLKERAEMV